MLEEMNPLAESRETVRERGIRELEKVARFEGDPERVNMALGCARTAVLIFIQLEDEEKLAIARKKVEELESKVASARAQAFEEELVRVRTAAFKLGLGSEAEIAAEKIGRVQEGCWIELMKRTELPLWDKQDDKQRWPMDPSIAHPVGEILRKIKAVEGVLKVEITGSWKIFRHGLSVPGAWVIRLVVDAEWGRRTYLLKI